LYLYCVQPEWRYGRTSDNENGRAPWIKI